MRLDELECPNLVFDEVCEKSVVIMTKPIYGNNVPNNSSFTVLTTKPIKDILLKAKLIPDARIRSVDYSSWSENVETNSKIFQFAFLDLSTVSLHCMVFIKDINQDTIYLYTGNFFTINSLKESNFFIENSKHISKLFFDNQVTEFDMKYYVDAIGGFIQNEPECDFLLYLPHFGYEDFLCDIVKTYHCTIHVNNARKILLQKHIEQRELFLSADSTARPNLIIHKNQNLSYHASEKNYKNLKLFTLVIPSLHAKKLKDCQFLMNIEWNEHPTVDLIKQLVELLPIDCDEYPIYNTYEYTSSLRKFFMNRILSRLASQEETIDESQIIADINTIENDVKIFNPQICSTQICGEQELSSQSIHLNSPMETETNNIYDVQEFNATENIGLINLECILSCKYTMNDSSDSISSESSNSICEEACLESSFEKLLAEF